MRRLLVLAMVLLVGCSGGDEAGPSPETVEEALLDAGLPICETNTGPAEGMAAWTLGEDCDEPVDIDDLAPGAEGDLYVGDARVLYSEDGPHPGLALAVPPLPIEWDWQGATIALGFGESPEAEAAIDGLPGAERLGEAP